MEIKNVDPVRIELPELLKASVAERARAVFLGFEILNIKGSSGPIYTKDEVKQIRESITSNEDKLEWNKLYAYFQVFLSIFKLLSHVEKTYKGTALDLLATFTELDYIISEENRLNRMIVAMREVGPEAEEAFIKTLRTFCFRSAQCNIVEIDGERFISLYKIDEPSVMNDEIKMKSSFCADSLSIVKGAVVAIEEFIESHSGSEEIVPSLIREPIKSAKTDYAERISLKYSVRNKTPNSKGPFFPDYFETKEDKTFYKVVKHSLSKLIEDYGLN